MLTWRQKESSRMFSIFLPPSRDRATVQDFSRRFSVSTTKVAKIGRTPVIKRSSLQLLVTEAILRSATVPVFLSRRPIFQCYSDAKAGRGALLITFPTPLDVDQTTDGEVAYASVFCVQWCRDWEARGV
ncbi:hypothetical protein AVEN_88977-1 [Araneus ventricosus]|uniref:Uncharacterized protein n=1 Tax=Araneus ventricosus TaxID=182803 RepID=A0A4Y2DKX5_ARAVE|nr:hypothetical protein AVEN_88977-1 [Araneus ventricosus]